jgi:hypothetical protein
MYAKYGTCHLYASISILVHCQSEGVQGMRGSGVLDCSNPSCFGITAVFCDPFRLCRKGCNRQGGGLSKKRGGYMGAEDPRFQCWTFCKDLGDLGVGIPVEGNPRSTRWGIISYRLFVTIKSLPISLKGISVLLIYTKSFIYFP